MFLAPLSRFGTTESEKREAAFISLLVDNENMKNVVGCLTRHKRWFLILGYTLLVIAFKFFRKEIAAGTSFSRLTLRRYSERERTQ